MTKNLSYQSTFDTPPQTHTATANMGYGSISYRADASSTIIYFSEETPGSPIAGKIEKKEAKSSKEVIKRRFRGIIREIGGYESRVTLEDGERRYDYYLRTDDLKKSGITEQNQPFEMDEIEQISSDSTPLFGYRYRKAADADDYVICETKLKPETKAKLEHLINKRRHT